VEPVIHSLIQRCQPRYAAANDSRYIGALRIWPTSRLAGCHVRRDPGR